MTITWPAIRAQLDQISSIVWWAASLATLILALDMVAHLYRLDIPLIPHVPAGQLVYAAGVLWLTKR